MEIVRQLKKTWTLSSSILIAHAAAFLNMLLAAKGLFTYRKAEPLEKARKTPSKLGERLSDGLFLATVSTQAILAYALLYPYHWGTMSCVSC